MLTSDKFKSWRDGSEILWCRGIREVYPLVELFPSIFLTIEKLVLGRPFWRKCLIQVSGNKI
jgi:hypothetical protein